MLLSVDIYHTTFDWPSTSSIASRLCEADGTSEKEMIVRLVEYHRNITGLRECYAHIVKQVNADQPKQDVFAQGTYSQPRSLGGGSDAACRTSSLRVHGCEHIT